LRNYRKTFAEIVILLYNISYKLNGDFDLGIIDFLNSGASFAEIIVTLGAWVIAILSALVIREVVRGYTAVKMGDNTPRFTGQLSLNPAKHFDPIGFLCILIVGFGWSKGMPINSNNFRNIKRGQILCSLSGILTNFAIFVVFTFLYALCLRFLDVSVLVLEFLTLTCLYTALINLFIGIFNLLPIYPLDGFSLVETFCSYDNRYVNFMHRYGSFVLLGVVVILMTFPVLTSWIYNYVFMGLFGLFAMIF